MTAPPQRPKRRRTPYEGLPDRQFWPKEPAIDNHALFDPVHRVPFRIGRSDKVVTAGSCFAERLGSKLATAGYRHFITEPASSLIPKPLARRFGYGIYAARYGNVYTPRQLLQLLHRAYGLFDPKAVAWRGEGDWIVDPFRPMIQPLGFVSEAELLHDRDVQFAAVRTAVEEMDVFVFTLGLTEAWEDATDGAVFPLAPGVAGGTWHGDRYRFVNFDQDETYRDLRAALDFIRGKNSGVRVVLTVSPVALNATYEDRHVWLSTTWSKAVLRIAAERAQASLDCAYFPSYEIITSPYVRGRYFDSDCRKVTAAGVDHVMKVFLGHFGSGTSDRGGEDDLGLREPSGSELAMELHSRLVEKQLDSYCDEQSITNR